MPLNASASRRSSKVALARQTAATGILRSLSPKLGRATHSQVKMKSRRNGKGQLRRLEKIKREKRLKIQRKQQGKRKKPKRRRIERNTTTMSTHSRSCAALSGWVASIRIKKKKISRFGGRAQRRRS